MMTAGSCGCPHSEPVGRGETHGQAHACGECGALWRWDARAGGFWRPVGQRSERLRLPLTSRLGWALDELDWLEAQAIELRAGLYEIVHVAGLVPAMRSSWVGSVSVKDECADHWERRGVTVAHADGSRGRVVVVSGERRAVIDALTDEEDRAAVVEALGGRWL